MLKVIDDLSSVLGLPVKNLRRDLTAIYKRTLDLAEKAGIENATNGYKFFENMLATPDARFKSNKSEANAKFKENPTFRNALETQKYEKAAKVISAFEDMAAGTEGAEKGNIQKMMIDFTEYIDGFEIPENVQNLMNEIYEETKSNDVFPFASSSSDLKIKYGDSEYEYVMDAKQYNQFSRDVYSVSVKAYEELLKDDYFKEQPKDVQLAMYKRLKNEKIEQLKKDMILNNVKVSDEDKKAEDLKQYEAAKKFKGTAGRDYIKVTTSRTFINPATGRKKTEKTGAYYEVSPEVKKEFDDYVSSNYAAVRKMLLNGTPLSSIQGFSNIKIDDKKINNPYNSYSKATQAKIDDAVMRTLKEQVNQNWNNDALRNNIKNNNPRLYKILSDVHSSEYVYALDEKVLNNIEQGDYSQNAWIRQKPTDFASQQEKQQIAAMNQQEQAQKTSTGNNIVKSAEQFLGVKYLWGGTSPKGFDCSGLVQYVCAQNGITVSRTAAQQYRNGVAVAKSDLRPGDLVFFKGYKTMDNPGHVGIYIGNDQMIHAPQSNDVVKKSKLSSRKDYIGARRVV